MKYLQMHINDIQSEGDPGERAITLQQPIIGDTQPSIADITVKIMLNTKIMYPSVNS